MCRTGRAGLVLRDADAGAAGAGDVAGVLDGDVTRAPTAMAAMPTVPLAEPSLVTLTSPPPWLNAPIAMPLVALISEIWPVVTVMSPTPQVNALMP